MWPLRYSLLLLVLGALVGCSSLRIAQISPEVTTYRTVTAADTALLVIRPGVGALLVYCDSGKVWHATSSSVKGTTAYELDFAQATDPAAFGLLPAPCLSETGPLRQGRPSQLTLKAYHDPYTHRPLRGMYVRANFESGENDSGGLLDSSGRLSLTISARQTVVNSGAIVDSQRYQLRFPIDSTMPPEVRARFEALQQKWVYVYEHSDTLVRHPTWVLLSHHDTTVAEVRLDSTRGQHAVRFYWPGDLQAATEEQYQLVAHPTLAGALLLRIRRQGGAWREVELYPHPQIRGFPAACR